MRNRMTKLGKIVGVLAISLALVGCGQAQSSTATGTKAETGTTAVASTSADTKASSSSSKTTSGSTSASEAVVTTEKPEINASDIWKKYDQKSDSHTPTYDGDQETATGVVTYIGKDDHGTDSLQISDTKGGTSYVLGVFGSAEEMSAVSVGDTITITGNFHIMSSHDMVVLKQCKITKIYQ